MERLTEKYLKGQTTPQEERELLQMLKSAEVLTPDDEALLMLLENEAPLLQGNTAWLEEDESALFDTLMRKEGWHDKQSPAACDPHLSIHSAPPRRTRWVLWTSVSLIAAMLCCVFYLNSTSFVTMVKGNSDNLAVTFIYGNRVENEQMALDMLEETMGELFAQNEVEDALSGFFE